MKKKILITENQLNKVKNIIKENISDDRYSDKLRVSIWTHGGEIKYNGKEIEDFSAPDVVVSFGIYDERRQWGIKSLEIVNIRGPEYIEVEVDYYTGDNEDDLELDNATIRLPLDWDNNLVTDTVEGTGTFSLGNQLDIELVKGEGGKVIAKMNIDINTF